MSNLAFSHITKAYPGVIAINDVSLKIDPGEVHALVGENGAGKSTLIKCLSGAVVPDSGEIIVDGKSYTHLIPKISQGLGIQVIYQEFNLIDRFSAAENIFLGRQYGKMFSKSNIEKKATEVFKEMGINLSSSMLVMDMSPAQKQLVEIAKAVSQNVNILVLDEPTGPLTIHETKFLFEIIRKLRDSGVAIIYISHRMEEIFEISDVCSVMRDGKLIGTKKTSDLTKNEIIQMMVGRDLSNDFAVRTNACIDHDKILLELDQVSGTRNKNVNMKLYSGEIVGLAGLVGAGRTELARIIFGADAKSSGVIKVAGKEQNFKSPYQAIKNGVGLIPEDRKEQGCVQNLSIAWNVTLPCLKKTGAHGLVNKNKEKQVVDTYAGPLNIKAPGTDTLVMTLSGGNQQKVVVAKTLATDSDIIIFDEPTRGIDVGAKAEIYKIMNDLTSSGKGILMVSSDMEELLNMSDRIYVMADGAIVGELQKEEFSQIRIMEMIVSGGAPS